MSAQVIDINRLSGVDDQYFYEDHQTNHQTDIQLGNQEADSSKLQVGGLYHKNRVQSAADLRTALLDQTPQRISYLSQRSFLNRTFGPLEKGSLRGSTFQLSAAALGSGVLSLPYVISQSGFLLGGFMIFIGAMAAVLSMLMLGRIAQHISAPSYTYIVRKVVGKHVDKYVIWLLVFGITGSSISYQIIITKMIQFLALNVGFERDYIYSIEMTIAIAAFMALCVLFPLGSLKQMSGFRYVSIISIASLLYIMFVLLFELPQYVMQNYSPDKITYVNLDWNIFPNFAITFFSFACHIEFVPIQDELNDPNMKRVKKVVYRSVLTNTMFYLLIGMAGYFSTYDKTAQIVIERDPLIGQKIDLPLVFGRVMIILVLCVAYPINLVPMKQIIIHKIYSRRHKMTHGQNLSMSLSFVILTSILAVIYPNITKILSIIGGVCSHMHL
eukprot:403354980